jgi:hypothetical protein
MPASPLAGAARGADAALVVSAFGVVPRPVPLAFAASTATRRLRSDGRDLLNHLIGGSQQRFGDG